MQKYIALLRGINVSGHKLIKMEALRAALSDLGLSGVSTYIQSGNVLFLSDEPAIDLEQKISEKILEVFGHEVTVIVRTPAEIRTALAENPFQERTLPESTQPYIGFLSDVPTAKAVQNLSDFDFGDDEWIIVGKRIYLWYGDSPANTKLSNAVIERKLGVVSTARNWKTTNKLLTLAL